ncbi:NF-kappa-B inhibitor zeta [Anabarilius grahami]|uniref:NF-kappa-B inhibitor zeta n=1 Tax=Anabarilius grahami TaxID=495550 RepID=A0A3N0YXE0_ANAGA|nr:NF-kappa-B inhibitor zeta [Anabarilius grahami]
MIIDRVSEECSGLLDRDTDVMTSPVNLWSFYGCSSPTEPNLSAGSPNSDSDQSWSDAGSPRNSFNEDLSARRGRYQGVRVKNTVKELIMQKRHHEIQVQQYQIESECPVTTHLLQRKREAENPSHCPVKRLRAADGNALSPCAQDENMFYEREMLDDIGEVLSIESVTVRGCPAPVCRPAQGQESLLALYTEAESCMYTDCCLMLPAQGTYTPSIPALGSLHVTADTPVSFFQWQIQQEEEKLSALSPVELTTRDGDGDTFLHIAVAQGRRALAFVLARKMAAIDMLDMKEHNHQSAFQVSVAADQHLIAQDLLSLGAEINTMDCWGRSPLHVCAEKGHASTLLAIQKSMVTSGRQVNVEVVNYDGLTPLHVAVLSHNAMVQELLCGGTPPSAQSPALLQKRKLLSECIATLLLMGASLETKVKVVLQPLQVPLCLMFPTHAFSPCFKQDRKSGRTALHMAAEEANIELLRLFLDQPSYFSVINAKAFNGNTVLHMASALQGRQAQVDVVRLLLRRGADPSAKNLENEQPAQLVPEGSLGDQVRRILKGKGAQSRS